MRSLVLCQNREERRSGSKTGKHIVVKPRERGGVSGGAADSGLSLSERAEVRKSAQGQLPRTRIWPLLANDFFFSGKPRVS